MAAAQRAFDDDIQRRNPKREDTVLYSSNVRFLSPIDNQSETGGADRFRSVDRHGAEKSHSAITKDVSYVPYDISAGASHLACTSREDTATMRPRTLKQLGDRTRALPQPTFSSPRTRLAMNLSDLGADYYSSPGSPVPSTPSSYGRLRKTKSVFSVSQVHPQPTPDQSPAGFPSRLLSKEAMMMDRRKSTSFLRGGTEFMPDSMRRQLVEARGGRPPPQQQQPYVKEQKPFYLSASCRRSQRPVAFPETVRAKKVPKEQPTDFISVRKAMGEKAKKVFGSMKRVFKARGKLEDTFPEQHVPASRSHFSGYVSPSELHDGIQDIPEPGNIRIHPNTVSRAPTVRTVPSFEMLHSIAGSIRDVTPNPSQSPVSTIRGVSVTTDGTSTWNSTLDRQSSSKKRLSIIDENIPHRIRENLYEPSSVEEFTQPRYEVRRVYSALMKRLDEGPTNPPQECQQYTYGLRYGSPESGCYMAAGLGLRPEEENTLTKPSESGQGRSTATSIRKSGTQKWGHPVGASRDRNSDPFYIPPVPQIPILYSPTAHKAQNIDSITAGWQETMEGADEEQIRLIAALQALSPIPSISREGDGKDTQNGRGSTTTLSITPQSMRTSPRRLRQTSSINFLPSPTKGSFGDTAPSWYRGPKSVGFPGIESVSITPPPPLRPPPLPPAVGAAAEQSTHDRDESSAVAGEKSKIRGKLRMKDYYSPNTTGAANGSKPRVYPRNQGLRLERSRSALAEKASRDIENAVNSQFGPVINRRASKTLVGFESLESSVAFI